MCMRCLVHTTKDIQYSKATRIVPCTCITCTRNMSFTQLECVPYLQRSWKTGIVVHSCYVPCPPPLISWPSQMACDKCLWYDCSKCCCRMRVVVYLWQETCAVLGTALSWCIRVCISQTPCGRHHEQPSD